MDQKITRNFSYCEFRPRNTPNTWLPTNDVQSMMIRTLASNLQIIHDAIPGPNQSVNITSGVRSAQDLIDLKAKGYNPSATSDHFCGLAVDIPSSETSKTSRFGTTYNYSVGAADCIAPAITPSVLFNIAIQCVKSGKCKFGQVIHEFNPATKAEWVHFSNDPLLFFSPAICKLIWRDKFLRSVDGGKTYQMVVV